MAGFYGKWHVCIFLRDYQVNFQAAVPFYIPTNSIWAFQFLHSPINDFIWSFFLILVNQMDV